jgi:hypothetical protein
MLFVFGFSIFLAACYQPKEGCLDLWATNFSIDADESCDDCCTYPKLKVALLNRLTANNPDGIFNLDSLYPTPFDESRFFKISDVKFYLSSLELIKTDGSQVTVSDSTWADLSSNPAGVSGVWLRSSLAWLNRRNSNTASLGSALTEGSFSGVSFYIGLTGLEPYAIPDSMPLGHPLALQPPDSTNWAPSTGYLFNQIEFFRDTLSTTPKSVIKITAPDAVLVDISAGFELRRGRDITVNLRVNYLDWFAGVDFSRDDDSVIRQKILTNLYSSFQLLSIQQ